METLYDMLIYRCLVPMSLTYVFYIILDRHIISKEKQFSAKAFGLLLSNCVD